MSRPHQYEDAGYGAGGAAGVHGVGGPSHEVPKVYHPQVQVTPPYGEYVDPAAAHGWQNAYDETAELPQVAGDGPVAVGPAGGGIAPVPVPGVGHGRRGSRRKPGRWRSRRLVVAVGAAGAVSAAALIAGFSLSGASPDGRQGKEGARSAPDESTRPAAPSSSDGSASPGSADTAEPGGTASAGAAASKGTPADASPGTAPDASPDESSSAESSSSASPATAPTATASPVDSAPGNSGGKGHGAGSTKRPK
ncbi:hypothetical protein ABZT03_24625 [Streptomyces sp. NPDC005574]|uniref:hypothetical protein n=1 Tax=Streptomyces sp. NPDC005574 TaxID=3156891 RepID=UPI0033B543F5